MIRDLKVDWEHIGATRSGSKWVTFRYEEPYNDTFIHRGETLRFTDPDEVAFALADVLVTIPMTPQEFVWFKFPYYEDWTLSHLLDKMNGYYPDATIRKDTECKVVRYEINAIIGDYNHGS